MVQSCDVPLTCLELAGTGPPMPFFDGESLASVLRGGVASDERAVFSAFSMGWPMIRTGPLKYIFHWKGDRVLFDMDADPGETRNIFDQHHDTAAHLHVHLMMQIERPKPDIWVR